jgi:2-oxoisovalerate dehydrogenase E1 component
MDLKKEPDMIEKLMFSNLKVEKMEDRKPDVLMPKEENPRVQQIAKKERFAFDANGKPIKQKSKGHKKSKLA